MAKFITKTIDNGITLSADIESARSVSYQKQDIGSGLKATVFTGQVTVDDIIDSDIGSKIKSYVDGSVSTGDYIKVDSDYSLELVKRSEIMTVQLDKDFSGKDKYTITYSIGATETLTDGDNAKAIALIFYFNKIASKEGFLKVHDDNRNKDHLINMKAVTAVQISGSVIMVYLKNGKSFQVTNLDSVKIVSDYLEAHAL